MKSYDVRFWAVKTNRKKDPETGRSRVLSHTVRWKVAGREKSKTYKNKAGAENFLSDLRQAAKSGEAFDAESGLPVSMARQGTGTTWFAYGASYVAKRWDRDAPNTRKAVVDALATFVSAVVRDLPERPERKALYRALCHYALPVVAEGRSRPEPPANLAAALRWLERASLPVSSVMDEDVLAVGLDALTLRLDGTPAAPNSAARKRSHVFNAMEKATKGKNRLLPKNPLPDADWKPAQVVARVDRRIVCNPRQARELLTAVTYVGRRDVLRGRRMVALFACMYYAGLRPAEAIALRERDCELPGDGWGFLYVARTLPQVGTRYTGTDDRHDPRGVKHRAPGDVRPVPIPPILVRMLRAHLAEFGTAGDGRLFRGPDGSFVTQQSYCQVWKRARVFALPPDKAASPLAMRPYDLRHAAVSTWLNSGVPPMTVAERAGHSVDVLLRVYAKCLDGEDAAANARIDRTLDDDN